MGLQQIMLVGALLAPCQAPLVVPNEASYTTDRKIEIPFTFDPVARADIREMIQYVLPRRQALGILHRHQADPGIGRVQGT